MTKKRPKVLTGDTQKVRTECGALYVTLNKDGKELYETIFKLGKAGTCQNAMFNMFGVLISILIQQNIPKDKLVRTLKKHMLGINCGSPFTFEDTKYKSCLDLIGNIVIKDIENESQEGRT